MAYIIYTQMEWLDPFDTVAFMAGVTEKVRLGLGVLIVPYRHPFDVARRVATIDILSGGRFVLGTGVGWLAETPPPDLGWRRVGVCPETGSRLWRWLAYCAKEETCCPCSIYR